MQAVEVDAKESKLPLYVSPEGKEGQSGVVVLQEWWGVNDQIKQRALTLSQQGFITAVPDLYRGKLAKDAETAGHYMKNLNWNQAIEDIRAAANYLRNEKKCAHVGVLGYCMGGALSLASSVLVNEVDCGVVYYGICDPNFADPLKLKKPVQCHFGTKDAHKGFSDPDSAKALDDKLKQTGLAHEFYMYEAGHAFANEARPDAYDKESANKALERSVAFLKKNFA